MQTLYYDTVIVGSGFAGRTVASYLPVETTMIVERGEDRDIGEAIKRHDAAFKAGARSVDAHEAAYRSDLPWNRLGALSRWNYSRYAMIRGGASNWWGGKSSRFSPEVFAAEGSLRWPFTLKEMEPWYARAELRLNVTGDLARPGNKSVVHMPGADYWRGAFAPYFKNGYLYNTALNKGNASTTGQGYCVGRSNCAVCHEDAKARPDNIFTPSPTLYETLVTRIEFEGDRAVALECFDGKQLFKVCFQRLILACNGIETPRLLARSDLPDGVRRDHIGAFLQDHAHYELSCKVEQPLIYGNGSGLAHVEVEEISGMYTTSIGQIEVSALALTHDPRAETLKAGMDLELLRRRGADAFLRDLNGCFDIFCEFEIPPEAGVRVDLESEEPGVLDDSYQNLIPAFDEVAREMNRRLALLGVSVLAANPIYRSGYGGHHFCGTTNCSDGPFRVVDTNMLLIGTSNVFIAGASVIPRAGGVAPTLTLVALAERLGQYLKDTDCNTVEVPTQTAQADIPSDITNDSAAAL